MEKIYTTENFRKGADRLYSQSGKLNCYIQNIKLVDQKRVTRELQGISTQAEYLLQQVTPKSEEKNVSKEE